MTINFEYIVVTVKLTEGSMKAICSLDFGGELTIRGFRIRDSEHDNDRGEKLWVTPPSYLGGGKWHPTAFFPDKNIWKKVEIRILDAYQEALKKRYSKAYGLSDEESAQYFNK